MDTSRLFETRVNHDCIKKLNTLVDINRAIILRLYERIDFLWQRKLFFEALTITICDVCKLSSLFWGYFVRNTSISFWFHHHHCDSFSYSIFYLCFQNQSYPLISCLSITCCKNKSSFSVVPVFFTILPRLSFLTFFIVFAKLFLNNIYKK